MKRLVLATIAMLAVGGTARAQTPILGSVLIFAGNFCPYGYAEMNGQLLPIASNTALFSVLGTIYGGNGTTNFALPNAKPIYTATRATFTQCIALVGIFPSRN